MREGGDGARERERERGRERERERKGREGGEREKPQPGICTPVLQSLSQSARGRRPGTRTTILTLVFC